MIFKFSSWDAFFLYCRYVSRHTALRISSNQSDILKFFFFLESILIFFLPMFNRVSFFWLFSLSHKSLFVNFNLIRKVKTVHAAPMWRTGRNETRYTFSNRLFYSTINNLVRAYINYLTVYVNACHCVLH